MATIKDLITLDFSKFDTEKTANLRNSIQKIIDDYNDEEDKPFFEKEASKNIDSLYGMVKKYVPEAIAVKEDKKEKKKLGEVKKKARGNDEILVLTDETIEKLMEIREDYTGGDLEDILQIIIEEMEEAKSNSDKTVISIALKQAIKKYMTWEDTIEKNQELRFGTVKYEEVDGRKNVVNILTALNDKITKSKTSGSSTKDEIKKGKSRTLIIHVDVVKEVIDHLIGLENEEAMESESELVVATTRMDLEDALSLDDDKFQKKIVRAVEDYEHFLNEVRSDKNALPSITYINILKKELGQKLIPEVLPTKSKNKVKEKSEKFMKELEAIEGDIDACRAVIREHNRKKREAEGPKPKKTRYTQLREKLLALINVMPDKLKEDVAIQEKTEGILLNTHTQLVRVWGMSKLKAKPGAKAIKEKFDDMEEKALKAERKTILTKWKNDLPEVDKVLPKISKDKQTLKEAAVEIVNHIRQAMALFEDDPTKAKKYLKQHFDQGQLENYLPKYVREALKL